LEAEGRRQKAEGRRQKAEGRRQEAGRRKINTLSISLSPHLPPSPHLPSPQSPICTINHIID